MTKSYELVASCTSHGNVCFLDTELLHQMVADFEAETSHLGMKSRLSHLSQLVRICISAGYKATAIGLLRQALALCCADDWRSGRLRHAAEASRIAREIDSLHAGLFAGMKPDCLTGCVLRLYKEIYWLTTLDRIPDLVDYFGDLCLSEPDLLSPCDLERLVAQLTAYRSRVPLIRKPT